MPRVTLPEAVRRRDIIDGAKRLADLQKNAHFLLMLDSTTRKKRVDDEVSKARNAFDAIVKDLEATLKVAMSKKTTPRPKALKKEPVVSDKP